MLLEKVIDRAHKEPEFDWESYYAWLFSRDAGRPVTGVTFWECRKCLTINLLYLPARYGKCRCCSLLHIPYS
jgi:hypothetical protein